MLSMKKKIPIIIFSLVSLIFLLFIYISYPKEAREQMLIGDETSMIEKLDDNTMEQSADIIENSIVKPVVEEMLIKDLDDMFIEGETSEIKQEKQEVEKKMIIIEKEA